MYSHMNGIALQHMPANMQTLDQKKNSNYEVHFNLITARLEAVGLKVPFRAMSATFCSVVEFKDKVFHLI